MIAFSIILILNVSLILLLALYPVVAWLHSVIFRKPSIKTENFAPPVSIIIACCNEEQYIKQKIDSFLDSEEWINGSEIIVISNGSTDKTNDLLLDYAENSKIRLIIEPNPSSKIKSVNLGVKLSKNDFLIFSDCRQLMKKGSVKQMIANFSDPSVGTVNSLLMDSVDKSKHSLRSMLNFISLCESRSGSSLNVFGALYAQRKSVFREIPTDLLFDDLFVVVSTLLQKKRLIAEKNAVIYDLSFEEYYGENRIQRLARGLLIFLFNHYRLIKQLPLLTYLRFMTFKYLKLILPFSLISLIPAFLFSHLVIIQPFCFVAFLAIISLFIFPQSRKILLHLLKINYNFMIATLQFLLLNKRTNTWDKLKVSKTS